MKTKMKLTSILLLAACFAATAETEDRLSKHFSVQPGGTLLVEVQVGTIEVKSSDANEVVVDVVRRISRATEVEEQDYLKGNPINIEADGNMVTIKSRAEIKEANGKGRRRTEVKYTITVPAKFNAQLQTSAGAVSASGLIGDVKVRSSGGELTFANLHGPLEAMTGAGAIRVTDCEGEQRVKTAGGGIEVFGGSGSLEGSTGGGLVAVKEFKGPVQMTSAGGGLTLENVNGRVDGKTGGGAIAARFSQPISEEVNLTTAGGGVTVRVPENAAFDLDAVTVGGNVSSEMTVESASPTRKGLRNRLKGTVNGGGKTVVIRSGGGGIQVRKS